MPAYKRKLSDKTRWYYSFSYLGEKKHSKCIYETKQSALKAERLKKKEIEENQRNPNKDISLKELCNLRLDYIESRHTKDYYKESKRHLKRLIGDIGDIPVSHIKKADVVKAITDEQQRLKKAGKTNHKANAYIRAIKAIFNYGIRHLDLTISNPCNMDLFPIRNELKYIPSDDDLSSLCEKCTNSQWELIQFVEQTGARIGEAINLKWEEVRDESIVLWTKKAKNSDMTSRIIPKPSILMGKSGKGKVFKSWNEYPRFLESRIDWNWHNLRHRRATIWAESGMNPYEIMQRLGHSNINTTMNYLKSLGVRLRFG